MTNKERNAKFAKARQAAARRMTAIQRDTMGELRRLLGQADRDIAALLAGQPSDFALWQLTGIRKSIARAMADLGDGLAGAGGTGMGKSWTAGIELVDRPLEAGGIRLAGLAPEIDTAQLVAMRSFMTDRMRDVGVKIAGRINSEIGLVAIGAKTPFEAIEAVAGLIEGGTGRATTIVRTELGRAFSVAGQARMEQASALLPGLKKQWRRSGKTHSREAHDLADGQVVGVDEPFTINGASLMFPRDPAGPAQETINCGCTTLPFMESWEVAQPGRHPFSDDEVRLNPKKRDLADALDG